MEIELNGNGLRAVDLKRIAEGTKVSFSADAIKRMEESRKTVEDMFEKGEAAYGTTTGIGELANVLLTKEQAKTFQTNLVYSHAGGYGEPVTIKEARAAIAARANTLAKGVSGIRVEVAKKIVELLNKGVTPVMYPASVGACGDLAPLAQGMLVLIGEGEAYYKGKRLSGKVALEGAKITPVEFEIRDGLAAINGSQLTLGIGTLALVDADNLVKTGEIAAAMSFEALLAVTRAFDSRILELRGFSGGVECASNIRRLIEGSQILVKQERIQDAYSIRSTPQVVGAVKDAIKWVRDNLEIELNGGADNPLFLGDGTYLTGANFQGTPIAIPLETLGVSVTIASVISERRLNRLVNKNLNEGLPAFLVEGAGEYSGIMIPQYTAASLINEMRMLCTPTAVGSIPTAADQEDFVSMGTNTAIKTQTIVDKSWAVIAIELMAAAQALDLRGGEPGKGIKTAYKFVRKYVSFLDKDRPLYKDIEKLTNAIKDGSLLRTVEAEIGELK